MNSRLIKWELKKQQHTYLPIILCCFIIVAVFLGSFLYFMNQQVFGKDQTQWLALWGEIGLFYAQLFFPLLIAIIVNAVWYQELEQNSWHMSSLLPIKGDRLLIAKVITASFYSLLSQIILINSLKSHGKRSLPSPFHFTICNHFNCFYSGIFNPYYSINSLIVNNLF